MRRFCRLCFTPWSAITSIDLSAADMLRDLTAELDKRGITVIVAHPRGRLRDMFASAGLGELIPIEHQFRSLDDGIEYYRRRLAIA